MIREKYENTTDWLMARHGVETGSKLQEEAEIERLFDFDETQDMRADERGHFMENAYAELHPELYHSDNEIFFADDKKLIGISPDFLDDENCPKVAVELKCVDDETEILTENGYIPIKELSNQNGIAIAQYTLDKKIEWTNEYFIFKNKYKGDIIDFYRYGCKILSVTPDHKIVYFISRNKTQNIETCFAKDYIGLNNRRLPIGGVINGERKLSDLDRIKIAICADGWVGERAKNVIYFEFSKERKIKRIKELISRTEISCELVGSHKFNNNRWNEAQRIKLTGENIAKYKTTLDKIIPLKEFNSKMAMEFLEEVALWDGTITKSGHISFSSTKKEDVDFLAALCVIANKQSNINFIENHKRNKNWNNAYMITISGGERKQLGLKEGIGFGSNTKLNENMQKRNYDGFVYCVSVPSGMFICRKPNKLGVVTGNCYQFAHHKEMYDKWKAKVDIFEPKTSRGLNAEQKRLLHQVQHYFRCFETLEEVRLTFFSPFAKEKEMREFYISFDKKILNK